MFFDEVNLGAYQVPEGRKLSPAHYFAWDLGNSARIQTIGSEKSPTVLFFWFIVYLICIPLRAVTYFSHYIGPNILGFVGTAASCAAIVASRAVFLLLLAMFFLKATAVTGGYEPGEILEPRLSSYNPVTKKQPEQKRLNETSAKLRNPTIFLAHLAGIPLENDKTLAIHTGIFNITFDKSCDKECRNDKRRKIIADKKKSYAEGLKKDTRGKCTIEKGYTAPRPPENVDYSDWYISPIESWEMDKESCQRALKHYEKIGKERVIMYPNKIWDILF